jgi:4-hydroxybenzoyl-CoA reductase subunit alpha
MQSGDEVPDVATISSCGLIDSLKKAKKMSNWTEKRKQLKDGKGIGVACYSFISGGVFNWFNTQYPFSAAEVRAFADGTVHLLTMASDIGQGSDTVLKQILAEELGLKMEDIRLTSADTAMTPQADLGTWGSRVTLMAGNAVVDAARQIKEKLAGAVFSKFNLNVIFKVEFKDGHVFADGKPERRMPFGEAVAAVQKANQGIPLVARGHYTPRGRGIVTPTFSFGTQVAQVDVDEETGIIGVDKLWTAHDCGTAINPMSVEGQLEGSVHMGLGYALSEQLIIEEGKTLNDRFMDYKIPAAVDMPPGESVRVDTYEPEGPMGAKEAGEGLVSPTAPAIGEGVFHATGFRCKELPITPEKLLRGIGKL